MFFAVGAVHLFVTLLGERAHGETMLLASAAILCTGALLRRRWTTTRRRWTTTRHHRPQVPQRQSSLPDLLAFPARDRELMRLRTTLPDRPGTLAALRDASPPAASTSSPCRSTRANAAQWTNSW
ncbi:hypothetical protein [Actinoplanes sp. NPDC023714]|uniref:hypothetical protein n=1 Tax=Actinoplanes sp. NPDC023714 TaxID=3154322 RepID=UPI0033ECD989